MALDITQGPQGGQHSPSVNWVSMHFSTWGHIGDAFRCMLEEESITITPEIAQFRDTLGIKCNGKVSSIVLAKNALLVSQLATKPKMFCDPEADYDPGIQETTTKLSELMTDAASHGRCMSFG